MKTEFIAFSVDHYSMEDNKGVNIRILGSETSTNNKFGREVVKVAIPDYNELEYLKRFEGKFPAKFKANQDLIMVKDRNGNEKGGIALSNVEFICEMEIVEKKAATKAS